MTQSDTNPSLPIQAHLMLLKAILVDTMGWLKKGDF